MEQYGYEDEALQLLEQSISAIKIPILIKSSTKKNWIHNPSKPNLKPSKSVLVKINTHAAEGKNFYDNVITSYNCRVSILLNIS